MKKTALITLALLALSGPGLAQTFWLGGGNKWHDSANWTNGVPNGNVAVFAQPTTETIDLGALVGNTSRIDFEGGDWTFPGGAFDCTQSAVPGERSFVVAGPPFSQAIVRLTGVLVRSLGVTDIALGSFSVGTLIVEGLGTVLINDNPIEGGWLAVGSRGQGLLQILDGGQVRTGVTGTTIGDFFEGTGGVLLVDGPGSLLETMVMSVAKRAPGELLITGGGTVRVQKWLALSDITDPNKPGQPAAPASTTVTGAGSLLETGLTGETTYVGLRGPAFLVVADGGALVSGGPILLGDPGGEASGLGSCDVTVTGAGSSLTSTDLSINGGLRLTWGSALLVGAGAEARGDKGVWIFDGVLTLDGGTLTGPTIRVVNSSTATLGGSGMVNGNLWNEGLVRTMNPSDHLTVNGGLLQGPDAVLEFAIHGPGVGVGHGDMGVAGAAALDGTLRLRFEGGYVPAAGDLFPLLSAGSLSGEFARLEVVDAANRSFELLQSGGVLTVRCLGEAIISYCECVVAPTCGNASPDSGCLNSTGLGALLTAQGAPALHLAGTPQALGFELTQVPASQFAILFMGPATANAPLGDGLLCVGTGGVGLFRFPAMQADANGRALWEDVPGFVADNFPPQGQFAVGERWYFQSWHRDPSGPCGTGSNTSQGLAVVFSY